MDQFRIRHTQLTKMYFSGATSSSSELNNSPWESDLDNSIRSSIHRYHGCVSRFDDLVQQNQPFLRYMRRFFYLVQTIQ